MNFGLHELVMSCVALTTLPVFFLAPGYLAASATGLMGFRQQTWIEKLVWSCALALPLALLGSVHPGLNISPRFTTASFVAVALLAAALAARDWKRSDIPVQWDRNASIALIVTVALVPYVLFSAVPFEVHGRIYESAIWQDWNVRIQLVNAAIRGGNTPGNPMFAAAGHPAPLRYYYFWYVLCARMHDLAPVSARAVLTASCVGVSFSLLAFLLLAVKYLSPSPVSDRRQYTAALLVACILGLDFIALIIDGLFHRVYSDVQFWLADRTPSFLHMVLWSPHHVAGLVCCGLGTLLFIHAREVSRRQQIVHGVLAGICFAASAGTSTFITLLFALACAVLFVDALRRREWSVPLTMLGATVLAAVLVVPFLKHVLLPASQPISAATQQATEALAGEVKPMPVGNGHFFAVTPRYKDQASIYVWHTLQLFSHKYKRRPVPGDPTYPAFRWISGVARQPYSAGMLVFDFGFYLFVLVYRARKDFGTPGPMPRPARLLWLMFITLAVPAFALSSGSLQGNNDLGRHAGFCLRLILLLWAAPLVAEYLVSREEARRTHTPLQLSRTAKWAVAFALIGLLGQVAQIVLVRARFPLTDARLLPQVVVEERLPHPAFRFGQVERAMAAAAAITPADAIIQWNPHSRMRNVYLMYTERQMAASDDGCNVPFGGDIRQCVLMTDALIRLFGGLGPHYHGSQDIFNPGAIGFDPATVTPENFHRVCSLYKLDTMVVSYVDPVWWDRQSWVWQLRPTFANSTARVFACAHSDPASAAVEPSSAPLNLVVH